MKGIPTSCPPSRGANFKGVHYTHPHKGDTELLLKGEGLKYVPPWAEGKDNS